MSITLLLACVSLTLGVIRFAGWAWGYFFSEAAQLKRLENSFEKKRAALMVEKARLEVEYLNIDKQPKKSIDETIDQLNKDFK